MKLNKLIKHIGGLNKLSQYGEKTELARFVTEQFKQLKKKNLKVPVTLFHL